MLTAPFSFVNKKKQLLSTEILSYLKDLNVGRIQDIEKEIPKIIKYLNSYLNVDRNRFFTFIDLFAGIGGMRIGFEKAGGTCVMTSENDQKALATYFCNFGDAIPVKFRDITKINVEDIPKYDVLLGGFPCQAFSIAGERKGFDDTRGTLFFDIQRIIQKTRPKSFLLENVKGLLNHDRGNTFKTILNILEKELKYKVYYKVLNTLSYGNIPQIRERVYIVGFDTKRFGEHVLFDFPKPLILTKKISDCLEKKHNDEALFYERFNMHNTISAQITKTNTVYQWRRVYVRENKNNACPTLTANMGTGGHNVPLIREVSSNRIRKLSPRECANFQGFPNRYYIPCFMANSHLYKQFGNSVSVPVIQRIAEKIVEVVCPRDIYLNTKNNIRK